MEIDSKTIVGVNRHHNSAVCLLKKGKVEFFLEEERLNRIKYEGIPFKNILYLRNLVDKLNGIALAGMKPLVQTIENNFNINLISFLLLRTLTKFEDKHKIVEKDFAREHHLTHAAGAFYNSGFDFALSIVFDGDGTYQDNGMTESTSCFYFDYKEHKIIDKQFQTLTDNFSLGKYYEKICLHFGFKNWQSAGKVMGLSSYGKDTGINFEEFIKKDNKHPLYTKTKNLKDFQESANLAFALQKFTQEKALNIILNMIKKTNIKNICLSGGYVLNCVANYYLKKHLPKDINLYVEPISSDAGTAMGAAKLLYYQITKSNHKHPQKNIYYGIDYNKDKILTPLQKEKTKTVSVKDVAKLLSENKIIAMFQGRSEAGPRALGNRSILFNPTKNNGKDIVNKVKHREFYRPFAGTILYEHTKDYFDMAGLQESPFMMYAVNVKKDKVKQIPAITHVDNTCRVQTLKKDFNKNFYSLISEFYKITGVPILLNTSFNLAGEPMVESIEDALNTLHKSKIDYLYLPEYNLLIE